MMKKDMQGAEPTPIIILVKPQLGENIGMCARAMWNCGVSELRIVRPRDGWPSSTALAASAGAKTVINSVKIFENIENAIGDLNLIFAASARPRGMIKLISTPWKAASEMHSAASVGLKTAIMFGQESKGLSNDEITLANKIISVPLNPDFNSLNLAQAVFVVCYEWHKLCHTGNLAKSSNLKESPSASKTDLIQLFNHLESELDACGFFQANEKRPSMVRNIRNIFSRIELTDQEVRTLRGIISSLVKFGGKNGRVKR